MTQPIIQPSHATRLAPHSPLFPLRPDWRLHFGPLDLPMPVDPAPGWDGHTHEDAEDGLVASPAYWGPEQPYSPGGSGIALGYACDDVRVVALAAVKCRARPVPYDREHLCRQFRYAVAWYEMTHDPVAAALVLEYADRSAADFQGTVYDGPEWVPNNVDQYLHMANAAPHSGVPMNLRECGHTAYLEAMALKLQPGRSTAFAEKILTLCALAAIPNTGQVGAGGNTGGGAIDQGETQYTFHWGLLVHGVLALCYQLGERAPRWVLDGMNALAALPRVDYYGVPSIPAFTFSLNGALLAATGPGQHGDPAFGWWSSNCVALESVAPGDGWAARATEIGPVDNVDEQTRKFTMLQRGWTKGSK